MTFGISLTGCSPHVAMMPDPRELAALAALLLWWAAWMYVPTILGG